MLSGSFFLPRKVKFPCHILRAIYLRTYILYRWAAGEGNNLFIKDNWPSFSISSLGFVGAV